MAESVPVEVDGVTFELAVEGHATVGPAAIMDDFDFDGVRDTVAVVGAQFKRVWETVRPDEATVEFGVSVKAKAGKLTSLIVEGEGEGTFKVSMTWRAPTSAVGPTTPGSASRASVIDR